MNTIITGTCMCVKDAMTVYEIIPEKRWTMDRIDGDAMADWIFETVLQGAENNPGFFRKQGYRILVAGKDFGCGSKSVEHPMAALKGAGIKLVIADSFSRYSYRNAINLGLPVIKYPGILDHVCNGDTLEVDIVTGRFCNLITDEMFHINPLSEFALKILSAGGSAEYALQQRKQMLKRG